MLSFVGTVLRPLRHWISSRTGVQLPQSRTQPVLEPVEQTSATDYDKKYADWMTTAVNQDTGNLPSCIFVHKMTIDWLPLLETDSHFLIHYDVYSSSVFRLDIGKRVDGHLLYETEPMDRTIEVLTPIEQLKRSDTKHLVLRQWVSQSRMNKVALDGGKEINLIFRDINIWVETRLPDGSEGRQKCRLPIPYQSEVRIPTQVELKSQ